jgi:beta-phosphoglucomutase-like phosphatase (HAD superfamily)
MLLDSVQAHAEAWSAALEGEGVVVPPEMIRPWWAWGRQALPAVSAIPSDDERGRRISERRGEIFRSRYLPHLRAFPMVQPLLRTLREHGLRLVVASSASKEDLAGLLSRSAGDGPGRRVRLR